MSEEEDDEVDLSDFQPTEWEMIMDNKFKQLNELGEVLPSTYKKPMMDLIHKMSEILSDLCYISFDNARKFKAFMESNYKLSQLEDLLQPPKQREPSENLDVV
jgi:hypothetical protein